MVCILPTNYIHRKTSFRQPNQLHPFPLNLVPSVSLPGAHPTPGPVVGRAVHTRGACRQSTERSPDGIDCGDIHLAPVTIDPVWTSPPRRPALFPPQPPGSHSGAAVSPRWRSSGGDSNGESSWMLSHGNRRRAVPVTKEIDTVTGPSPSLPYPSPSHDTITTHHGTTRGTNQIHPATARPAQSEP